jgi:hypothetical protein
MPSLPSLLTTARRSLAGHLSRLGRSFENLAGQVREAIACSIGRTAAEAVAEAVHAALAESSADAGLPPAPPSYPGRPPPLWTSLRVREVIKRHFGIDFCRSQVSHILTDYMKWTAKRPVNELKKQNNEEIAEWLGTKFPRMLADAEDRKAHLVFVDETGFMMYPTVRKSFSPRGQAPVNKVSDPHGRISTIGAIAISPDRNKLSWHYFSLDDNCNFRGPAVVAFLEQLSNAISGPMIVI